MNSCVRYLHILFLVGGLRCFAADYTHSCVEITADAQHFEQKLPLLMTIMNSENGVFTLADSTRLKQIYEFLHEMITDAVNDCTMYAAEKKTILANFFAVVFATCVKCDIAFAMETIPDAGIRLQKIFYQQRQVILLSIVSRLFDLLQQDWYRNLGCLGHSLNAEAWHYNSLVSAQELNKLSNTVLSQSIDKKAYSIKTWKSRFLTMFRRWWDVERECIDFPDLYTHYRVLCEEYLEASSQVHQKFFLTDTAVQKTLSEKITLLLHQLAQTFDATSRMMYKQQEAQYASQREMLRVLMLLVYKNAHELAIMPEIMTACASNSTKLDILVQDRLLRSSYGFVNLASSNKYLDQIYAYESCVDSYLQHQDRAFFNADYLVSLYILIEQLDALRIEHMQTVPQWLVGYKSGLCSVFENMLSIARMIMLDVNNKPSQDTLFNKILSGEWIAAMMNGAAKNTSFFESIKQAAYGDTHDLKHMAMKAFLYTSPVLALGLLKRIAPEFGEDMRKKIVAFIIGEHTGNAQGLMPQEDVSSSASMRAFIEKNPEIITELVNKNPQLAEQMARQLQALTAQNGVIAS